MTDRLLDAQNPDGGWTYRRGASWVEPTAYALLAVAAARESARFSRGAAWIRKAQQPDGSWPVQPGVGGAAWVTALAALLGPETLGDAPFSRAVNWIAAQVSQAHTWSERARLALFGHGCNDASTHGGFSWVPGTAGWVTPTAVSVLALEKALRLRADTVVQERAQLGRGYLLSRRCRDGGWNHGAYRVLGVEADSYPETTGLGLLALHGDELPQSRDLAARQLASCRTAEGTSWLRMALLAHGRSPASPRAPRCFDTRDCALAAIADQAAKGRNPLLV